MKKFTVLSFLGFFVFGFAQQQLFTTPGTNAFTPHNSTVSLKVECIGGGGAGGRVEGDSWTFINYEAAGGGGGGAYVQAIVNIVGGNTYNINVGSGGVSNGADGGNTWFGSNTTVMAEGGKTRGGVNNSGGANGGKAANSYGNIKYDGGNGGSGDSNDAGGGGGGAGSTGNGGNGVSGGGSGTPDGGTGSIDYGGNGGGGGYNGNTGENGYTYGGGGGGSSIQSNTDRNGGAGASGLAIIQWCEVHSISKTHFCSNIVDTLYITGSNYTMVDSVVLNHANLTFTILNTSTIRVILPAGISSGELLVHTKNGTAKSDSIFVQSNTLNLTVDSNIITANYTGNHNTANWYWFNCANNDTLVADSVGTLTVTEIGAYALHIEENGCITSAPCEVVTSIPDTTIAPIDTVVVPPDTTNTDTTGTAIRNVESANLVQVYPNPTSNQLFISSAEDIITQISVFSTTGYCVFKEDINLKETAINFSNIPKGIYIVKIILNQKVNTYQVVNK